MKIAAWTRSSRRESHQCVEVLAEPDAVRIRDAAGRTITVTPGAWTAFLRHLRE